MTGVIYARYSSDNQREESIEGQIRENNQLRTMHKYILFDKNRIEKCLEKY